MVEIGQQDRGKETTRGLPVELVFGRRDEVAIVYLEDILTENTRKVRRSLLALSFIAIVGVTTGLTPKTILGVEVGQANQRLLLGLLASAILYHLVVFILDGWRDFLVFSRKTDEASAAYSEALRKENPQFPTTIFGFENLKKDERHIYHCRFLLQMIFPLLVALTGLIMAIVGAVQQLGA